MFSADISVWSLQLWDFVTWNRTVYFCVLFAFWVLKLSVDTKVCFLLKMQNLFEILIVFTLQYLPIFSTGNLQCSVFVCMRFCFCFFQMLSVCVLFDSYNLLVFSSHCLLLVFSSHCLLLAYSSYCHSILLWEFVFMNLTRKWLYDDRLPVVKVE
jgi:hypothetical protein